MKIIIKFEGSNEVFKKALNDKKTSVEDKDDEVEID